MSTDQEIIAQYSELNRGDVALGRKPNQQRSHKQRFALRGNVEPGDLFNRTNPSGNYQYTWCPFADINYFQDCKEEGYKVVVEKEWINNKESREWYKPEKEKWRWSVAAMLVNRDEFLMYRDEELWAQEQLNRLNLTDPDGPQDPELRKEAAVESASRIARDAGIEVDIESNGRPNRAGVRRTIVS